MNAHELAATLHVGMILYHTQHKDSHGNPVRWYITSIRTWKTDLVRIRIGIKHGLYDYDTILSLEDYYANFSNENT